MSYFRFWPIFSTAGSSRIGFKAARVAAGVEVRLARRRRKRQIPGLAFVPGKRHAHQFGPTRPDAGRLGIEREGLLLPELGEKRLERLGRVDEMGGEGVRSRSTEYGVGDGRAGRGGAASPDCIRLRGSGLSVSVFVSPLPASALSLPRGQRRHLLPEAAEAELVEQGQRRRRTSIWPARPASQSMSIGTWASSRTNSRLNRA